MNKSLIVLLIILIGSVNTYCQQTAKPHDYTYYLELLGNSKDTLYDSIISQFDRYIQQNPWDFKVSMERCRLIENAYYDSYEEYNPKYDEALACVDTLVQTFPTEPEARLFEVEYQYGEDRITLLEELNKDALVNGKWRTHKWKLYKLLAESYSENEETQKAVRFGILAKEEKDSLDLSLMMGRLYKEQNKIQLAINELSGSIDTLDSSWDLNQKGRLLLELGAPEKALEAFRLAKRDSTGWQDQSALAQTLIDNGFHEEAREFLVKEVEDNSWRQDKALRKLFEFDLAHSSVDSAHAAYDKMVALNFMSDPIGYDRIRILFRAPLAHWSFDDFLHILILVLVLAIFLVLPYMWILPIHYLGTWFRSRGMQLPASDFRWGLRHFWYICSGYFLISLVALAIADYPSIISIFDDTFGYDEVVPLINKASATLAVLFFSGSLIMTVFLIKRNDLRLFWGTVTNKSQAIWLGVGLAFLLKIGVGIYAFVLRLFDISLRDESFGVASITNDIMAVNQYYHPILGFAMVVILVPIYEEILFRGVFLSACEKHMKFFFANCLQAFAFALVHQELKLIPFYFAFAFLCGHYRNKTQSLATGISLHITNNLIAFIGILILQSRMNIPVL